MLSRGDRVWIVWPLGRQAFAPYPCTILEVLHKLGDGMLGYNVAVYEKCGRREEQVVLSDAQRLDEKHLLRMKANGCKVLDWSMRTKAIQEDEQDVMKKTKKRQRVEKTAGSGPDTDATMAATGNNHPGSSTKMRASTHAVRATASCACKCHASWLTQNTDALKRAVLGVDMNDIAMPTATPQQGFKLVAKRDLPVNTVMFAQCNLKFEHVNAVSSTIRYEINARISHDIMTSLFPDEDNPEDTWNPVLCPLRDQILRYANLPSPPPCMMHASERELLQFVEDHHNTAFVSVLDWPYMVAITCRPIKKGDDILIHYGPGSHTILRTSIMEARTDG